jgi:hypothetical protein
VIFDRYGDLSIKWDVKCRHWYAAETDDWVVERRFRQVDR